MSLAWRAWAVALLLSFGPLAQAQEERFIERFDGSLSVHADVWSRSRQLDRERSIGTTSAWARLTADLDDLGWVVASGWVRAQTQNDGQEVPPGRVRELYWRFDVGAFDVRLGRQIIAWGRADGLNPTDFLSRKEYTLLTPEDGDQRYGTDAAQVMFNTESSSLSLVWMPRAHSHTIPLTRITGVDYAVESPPEKAQWGAKWELSGAGFDGSLSYFDGYDPLPDLSLAAATPTGVTIAVRNHRARVVGADLSMTKGRTVWRAEAAYVDTESRGASDFEQKKSQVSVVAGPEVSIADTTTIGIQAIGVKVFDFGDPAAIADPIAQRVAVRQAAIANQSSAELGGFTARIAKRWLNETLQAEVSGAMLWPRASGVWRTKVSYSVDDRLQVQAGGDVYFGSERGLFGQLRDNSLFFLQMRYSW